MSFSYHFESKCCIAAFTNVYMELVTEDSIYIDFVETKLTLSKTSLSVSPVKYIGVIYKQYTFTISCGIYYTINKTKRGIFIIVF